MKTLPGNYLEISLTAYSGVMEQLDVGIVPYIVLLVVPVLGRMSDQTDSVRFMATQCFATLIRLMPLEVSWRNFVHKYSVFYNIITIAIFKHLFWLGGHVPLKVRGLNSGPSYYNTSLSLKDHNVSLPPNKHVNTKQPCCVNVYLISPWVKFVLKE